MRIAQALAAARARIAAADARLLLGEALQRPAAWLLAHDDEDMPPAAQQCFDDWVARRAQGEPVAYLIGRREFFGRDFSVAPGVLIPRPETELLVEQARQVCAGGTAVSRPDAPGSGPSLPAVLDLGTGSGCIAISIALECPQAQVTALDQSDAALAIAAHNAAALRANIRLLRSDWFAALGTARFDLIVSNPPYIRADDEHLAQGDLRFEPLPALASGEDGFDALRTVIGGAHAHLNSGGALWLEHGYDQSAQVRALLRTAGFADVASRRDLAGIERISGGYWPGRA